MRDVFKDISHRSRIGFSASIYRRTVRLCRTPDSQKPQWVRQQISKLQVAFASSAPILAQFIMAMSAPVSVEQHAAALAKAIELEPVGSQVCGGSFHSAKHGSTHVQLPATLISKDASSRSISGSSVFDGFELADDTATFCLYAHSL